MLASCGTRRLTTPLLPPQQTFSYTKKLVLILFFCLFSSEAFADHHPDSYYENLYKRIESAVDEENFKKTDFLSARYIGASFLDSATKKGIGDLNNILKKRKLPPASFLSSEYDKEFVDWFVKCAYVNWGGAQEHIRERAGVFEIRAAAQGQYFVTVTAAPELQAWFVVGENAKPLILPVSSPRIKPLIYSGKLVNKSPMISFPVLELETGKRRLLYMWEPEFYDLDGDKIPEVFLRYNLTSNNGYVQMLDIYKILEDNRLKLFKKFTADPEGVARLHPDGKIQVGWGIASNPAIPHLNFDRYHFETWEYVNGSFKKISEEKEPHILKGKDWKKYYLDSHESWMKKYQ